MNVILLDTVKSTNLYIQVYIFFFTCFGLEKKILQTVMQHFFSTIKIYQLIKKSFSLARNFKTLFSLNLYIYVERSSHLCTITDTVM